MNTKMRWKRKTNEEEEAVAVVKKDIGISKANEAEGKRNQEKDKKQEMSNKLETAKVETEKKQKVEKRQDTNKPEAEGQATAEASAGTQEATKKPATALSRRSRHIQRHLQRSRSRTQSRAKARVANAEDKKPDEEVVAATPDMDKEKANLSRPVTPSNAASGTGTERWRRTRSFRMGGGDKSLSATEGDPAQQVTDPIALLRKLSSPRRKTKTPGAPRKRGTPSMLLSTTPKPEKKRGNGQKQKKKKKRKGQKNVGRKKKEYTKFNEKKPENTATKDEETKEKTEVEEDDDIRAWMKGTTDSTTPDSPLPRRRLEESVDDNEEALPPVGETGSSGLYYVDANGLKLQYPDVVNADSSGSASEAAASAKGSRLRRLISGRKAIHHPVESSVVSVLTDDSGVTITDDEDEEEEDSRLGACGCGESNASQDELSEASCLGLMKYWKAVCAGHEANAREEKQREENGQAKEKKSSGWILGFNLNSGTDDDDEHEEDEEDDEGAEDEYTTDEDEEMGPLSGLLIVAHGHRHGKPRSIAGRSTTSHRTGDKRSMADDEYRDSPDKRGSGRHSVRSGNNRREDGKREQHSASPTEETSLNSHSASKFADEANSGWCGGNIAVCCVV